jgi:hypothetical protein
MITMTRSLLCVVFLAAGFSVRAADPAPGRAGRVLVLDNEHTLEGDIVREGNDYHVRRGGAETWLPGDKVLCLCGSYEEAYEFLRGRANLQDADERLRLARWCHLHNLRAQAHAEAAAAVALRPSDRDAAQVLHSLDRAAAAAQARPDPGKREEPGPEALPPVDFNSEALGPFGTRVQPILMNTCASCHAGGHAGAFKLQRVFEDGVANRRATQHNLAAALAQVNPEHPLSSPLLVKAVSIHGDLGQAPLKGRQTPTYRALEEWVQLAVGQGTPHEFAAPVAMPEGAAPKSELAPVEVHPASPSGPPSSFAVPPSTAAPPAGPTERAPVDPFDPVLFNRQMHPAKGN